MRLDNFPLYSEKIMASLSLKALSPLGFCCYCKILFTSFNQNKQCYIENDDVILAKVCNITAEDWLSVKESVLAEFSIDGLFIYDDVLLKIYNTEKKKKTRDENLKAMKALNYTFEQFWHDYDKKVGSLERLGKKWTKLSNEDRELIKKHIPLYKEARPDKQSRKDPATYLNNTAWLDEIIPFKPFKQIVNKNHEHGTGERI